MKTLIILVAVGLPAFADLLTFPDSVCSANSDGSGAFTTCSDYSFINQAYGDTADATVTYIDKINTGQSLRWWATGYNDLPTAVWGGNGDGTGQSWDRIQITPNGNLSVTLNGFDLGAYNMTQRFTDLQILDAVTGSVLVDYGTQLIGAGNTATHFSPDVSSPDGIAIEWKDTGYNVGIDNIDFSVSGGTVPEPAAYVPVALLLAGLAICRWRICKAS
ncbi:MAG: hypothetical protein JO099_08620 [Acidobacteriia bacterium]|nr:hypothetical protein [Terriglobia bacterium]